MGTSIEVQLIEIHCVVYLLWCCCFLDSLHLIVLICGSCFIHWCQSQTFLCILTNRSDQWTNEKCIAGFVQYWKVLELDCLSRKVLEFVWSLESPWIVTMYFFIFINSKYDCESKTRIVCWNVIWQFRLSVCCLAFKPRDYAGWLLHAVSAFLQLLLCFAWWTNVHSTAYGWALNLGNFQKNILETNCPWKVLEFWFDKAVRTLAL